MEGKQPDQAREISRVHELRAMGSLSMICWCATAVLWVSGLSGLAWPRMLLLCLASFLVSWLAATFGSRCLMSRMAGEYDPRPLSADVAAQLARYGLFLGIVSFAVSFLLGRQ